MSRVLIGRILNVSKGVKSCGFFKFWGTDKGTRGWRQLRVSKIVAGCTLGTPDLSSDKRAPRTRETAQRSRQVSGVCAVHVSQNARPQTPGAAKIRAYLTWRRALSSCEEFGPRRPRCCQLLGSAAPRSRKGKNRWDDMLSPLCLIRTDERDPRAPAK